jgi:hypothetical protein
MIGAGNGGAKCHGIGGEVGFLLVILSLRTLFSAVISCRGGVEAENPTLEHGVPDVNQAWKCFGITQGQRCNRRFNSVQLVSYERLLAIVLCL